MKFFRYLLVASMFFLSTALIPLSHNVQAQESEVTLQPGAWTIGKIKVSSTHPDWGGDGLSMEITFTVDEDGKTLLGDAAFSSKISDTTAREISGAWASIVENGTITGQISVPWYADQFQVLYMTISWAGKIVSATQVEGIAVITSGNSIVVRNLEWVAQPVS